MKTTTALHRVIYVVETADPRKVGEARFKLSSMKYGYGKKDNFHYWSVPCESGDASFKVLSAIFGHVRRV